MHSKKWTKKISEIANIEDFVMVLSQMIDREYIVPPPLVGNWNNKITLWESKNEEILQEFHSFTINLLVRKWTKFETQTAIELLKPLKKLIEKAQNFNLHIFSLNYDTMLESVLNSKKETLIDTGFSKNQWDGDFNHPNSPAKIKLYKLHGSIDWSFDEEKEIVQITSTPKENKHPLIIFGSGPKMQSFDPFLTLLGEFNEKLKSANLFVIIGYSFQDRYVNNILIQNLSSSLNKKMLIIDPFLESNAQNFIKRIENLQKSKSMYEIANLTQISPDKIEIRTSTAKKMFKEFLENDCEKLKQLLESTERGETPF